MMVDPRGRLIVGLFTEDRTSTHGSLESVDPVTRSVRTLMGGMVTANGLALSPDQTRLYAVDTARGTLSCLDYDVETGSATRSRVVVRSLGPGRLDGISVDAQGHIWMAVWDASQVRRYDPTGVLLEVLQTPVSRPSAVALVGAREDLLVITTARQDLAATGGRPPPSAEGRLYSCPIRR